MQKELNYGRGREVFSLTTASKKALRLEGLWHFEKKKNITKHTQRERQRQREVGTLILRIRAKEKRRIE